MSAFFIGIIQINAFLMFVFGIYLVLFSKGNKMLNRLLGVLFFNRMLLNIYILIVFGPFGAFLTKAIMIIPVLSLLAEPCIYFYIRFYLNDDPKLRKWDLLHLMPFIICMLNVSPTLFSPGTLAQEYVEAVTTIADNSKLTLFFSWRFQLTIKSVIMLAYCGYSLFLLLNKIQLQDSSLSKPTKYWLFSFLVLSFAKNILNILMTFKVPFQENAGNNILESTFLVVSFIILMIIMMLYLVWQPSILYGNVLSRQIAERASGVTSVDVEKNTENQSFTLPECQTLQYREHLINVMLQEKPYLEPYLSIALLSDKLGIRQHHLSYLLNQVIKQNFRDYVNQYRIAHFLREYQLHQHQLTLETVALQSGFKTYRTFFNAFKKETGDTPAAYFQKINS